MQDLEDRANGKGSKIHDTADDTDPLGRLGLSRGKGPLSESRRLSNLPAVIASTSRPLLGVRVGFKPVEEPPIRDHSISRALVLNQQLTTAYGHHMRVDRFCARRSFPRKIHSGQLAQICIPSCTVPKKLLPRCCSSRMIA